MDETLGMTVVEILPCLLINRNINALIACLHAILLAAVVPPALRRARRHLDRDLPALPQAAPADPTLHAKVTSATNAAMKNAILMRIWNIWKSTMKSSRT